jgi:hypothetical protein
MNDMRLLLEEQTSRNALLEKKQKKFDSELAMVSAYLKFYPFLPVHVFTRKIKKANCSPYILISG